MSPDEPTIDDLKRVLRAANYTAEGIESAGVDVGLGVRRPDLPILARALRDREPLATLVRLFLLSDALHPDDVERVGLDAPALARAGVVERRRGRVQATLSITPWRGFLVAHDPDPPGELWPTHVTGPNPAADALAALAIGSPIDSALDIGTGCGLLALTTSRHARRVLGTDVNPHAMRLAALNAQLNDVSNVELREGSFFEPIDAAERFELIVSNPPYVIGPDADLVFRYSPLPRDEVSRTVLAGAVRHLAERGYAVTACNWIVSRGEHWSSAPARWLERSGCDAVVLRHAIEDPLAYAVRWNIRLQHVSPERYGPTLDRWLAYFERERIEAICSGSVVLRRRADARNWTHGLELDRESGDNAGQHVLAVFEGMDYLSANADDATILADSFALVDPHRLDQALTFRDGRYSIGEASLRRGDGLGVRLAVEPALNGVLLRMDGATPLGEVLDAVAAETGIDPVEMRAAGIALVRRLLGLGFAVRR